MELPGGIPVHSCGSDSGDEEIKACRLTDSGPETIF